MSDDGTTTDAPLERWNDGTGEKEERNVWGGVAK